MRPPMPLQGSTRLSARIILVHGAFHGAWCWDPVVAGLRAQDVEVTAVDLAAPGDGGAAGLAEHALAVRSEIAAGDPPTILCGHSYGGTVISEASDPAHPVEHLVYIAGAVPANGEGMLDCLPEIREAAIAQASAPHPTIADAIAIDPDRAVDIFYHDCPEETARDAVAQLRPQSAWSLTDPSAYEAWRTTPSTYVVCDRDRAIEPSAQERVAKRCTHRVAWPTSHSPMLSQPERVVSLLAALADSF